MKVGIIGSGVIVQNALTTFKNIEDTKCTAMYYRSVDKESALQVQADYGIDTIYDDIDAFLKDDSYEVIYVGVINSSHYEFTKKALLAKKDVICEKAFTSTYQEAKELVDLAAQNKCYLFEAIMLRYLDNYAKIKEVLPSVGDITMVQCNYSQYSSRYDTYLAGTVLPAFDPKLSGGSLYDINVYNVHFTTGLFGKPKDVHYYANIGYNGIDTSGMMILDYGDFKAVCSGAKDSDSPARCTVQGSKGYINVNSLPGMVRDVEVALKNEKYVIDIDRIDNPMENEFRKIFEMIKNQDEKTMHQYLEDTLITMEVLEAGRKDAGIKFSADRK